MKNMKRIYLDYNASTPLDPRVLKVLINELEEEKGNPSSIHFHGQQCRRKLEKSRETISRFFHVKPHEVIFTSCGTEGAALLLRGMMLRHPKGHIISSVAEHACVDQTLKELEKEGVEVTFLPVGAWGAVRPEEVERAILPHTRLITLIAANNETGVITDLEAIASIAQRANIPFIVDGVAWLGKEMVRIPNGVSALFFSGHKIYGPKGSGFCICSSNLKLTPLFVGGGQEYNRRSGTENLPGIVALASALTFLEQEQEADIAHLRRMRDQLEQGLLARLPHLVVNGTGPRISNTANLAFLGVDGETLLMNLDMEGISVSHGSACASGALEPSRILLAMGIPLPQARSSLRFSVGRMTTEEEIHQAIATIIRVVERLRSMKQDLKGQ
jgi:cysteine desulfurase